MRTEPPDKPVQRRVTPVCGGQALILRETNRAVTPFGGLSVWAQFLDSIGLVTALRRWMPFQPRSPNHIDPAEILIAFLTAVITGARRFAHTSWLRADVALHALLGLRRFPSDDTIRNFFRRFREGDIHRLFDPLTPWMLARLPHWPGGYSLDLDSTVFERYGRQQGALKGHNPRKHGRPSHHPLLAVLAEAHHLLHGWLRSGNTGSARGVVPFLEEALALWDQRQAIRVVRADSGFFDDQLLSFLEKRGLPYIVVARLTRLVHMELRRVEHWQPVDGFYSVGEFRAGLLGWKVERRFVVVRELLRETKRSPGRKLIDVPGYSFRVFVTNRNDPPVEIWRDYNRRADMENRIAELKHDLGADGFALQKFFATEAAFRSVLLLFNLLAEFQRRIGWKRYREPATLRSQVLVCGAILGRAGRRLVLHLSSAWGGLTTRTDYFDNILQASAATAPKLAPAPS